MKKACIIDGKDSALLLCLAGATAEFERCEVHVSRGGGARVCSDDMRA